MVSKSMQSNPGPGTYVPKGNRYKNSPKWGVGTSRRAEMANTMTKFVPGPSAYEIKGRVGEAPAYVMGEKTVLRENKKVPGPGTYSPIRVTDVSASYSMGSKTKFGMNIAVDPESGEHTKMASYADKTPGPGVYQPKPVYKNVNSGPRFGTDSRKGLGDQHGGRTPGPNAYRSDSKSNV